MQSINTARTATPPGHTPTLKEALGYGEASTAHQYCEAIHRWLLGRDHPLFITELEMWAVMGQRSVIPGWSKVILWK